MKRLFIHRQLHTDNFYGTPEFWKAVRVLEMYGLAGWVQR